MDKLQKEAKRQHVKQWMMRCKHPRLYHRELVCRIIYEKSRVDPEKNNQVSGHEKQPQRRALFSPCGEFLPAAFRRHLPPSSSGLRGKARLAVPDDNDKKEKGDETPRD